MSTGTTMTEPSKHATGNGKSKGGAPAGNANRLRHGLRAGKLPKGCEYIEKRVNAFRRQLEEAVIAVKREVSLVDAAAIHTACQWVRHGSLAAHWLRHEAGRMTPSDRLRFSGEVARASDNRDRAIRQLDLERDADPDAWLRDFYRDPPPQPEPQIAPESDATSEPTSEPSGTSDATHAANGATSQADTEPQP